MQLAVVIMAAGKGTRLKSKRAKVLHEAGGKTLLRRVVDAARRIVQPSDIYVVVGHQAEQVKQSLSDLNLNFVHQAEQRGTGHAIQQAAPAVAGYAHIIVLSGDAPMIQPQTIARLRDFHIGRSSAMTILTAMAENPHGYGRVIRKAAGSDEVLEIVEQSALNAGHAHEREINSGIYAFSRQALDARLGSLESKNTHGEYYLTDLAAILVSAGQRVLALEASEEEVAGANTIEEVMRLDALLRLRTARRLMASGVTIFRPETSVIDEDVEIGKDTVIEPFVELLGRTTVGEDCRIRSFSILEDATLGTNVLVRNACTVVQSRIGDGAQIGPYAHLRPGSEIGDEAHVGNFVEIKNTILGKRSKANHLTYLGDASIGEGANIGAGVITCNYDGAVKHRTNIGNQVFVGSDSTLVAPLTLGEGAYIAAGSCITEDVPENALALARSRQTIKENWAKTRPRKR